MANTSHHFEPMAEAPSMCAYCGRAASNDAHGAQSTLWPAASVGRQAWRSHWSYSKAEERHEEAILSHERQLGQSAPWVARAMSNTLPPSAHGAAAYVGRERSR